MRNAKQYWQRHIEAIKAQGVQTSAYAKRHGLSLASLYAWQRKLKDEGSAPKSKLSRNQFVALQVVKDSIASRVMVASPAPVRCTLVLGSGMRLEMQSLPDPQWLLALSEATGASRVARVA